MIKMRTILVPMDFSNHSECALRYAIDLAKTFDAKIHLLHCYLTDVFQVSVYGAPYISDLPKDFDRPWREAAEKKLSEYREQVESEGVAAESRVSQQVPSDAILRLAGELKADLIVMGTRGLTGLKHVLLGSTAERTVRTAHCPVLTIKHDER